MASYPAPTQRNSATQSPNSSGSANVAWWEGTRLGGSTNSPSHARVGSVNIQRTEPTGRAVVINGGLSESDAMAAAMAQSLAASRASAANGGRMQTGEQTRLLNPEYVVVNIQLH